MGTAGGEPEPPEDCLVKLIVKAGLSRSLHQPKSALFLAEAGEISSLRVSKFEPTSTSRFLQQNGRFDL